MSVPFNQSTDFLKINMQEHDRDAFSIHMSTGDVITTNIVEDSGSRPPSAPPQSKPMDSDTEPPPASFKSEIMEPGSEPHPASSKSNKPQKVSGTGPPPSSPKNTNNGSSSKTSSVLKDYEEPSQQFYVYNKEEEVQIHGYGRPINGAPPET
ncbi:hypothetical protein P9112_009560 [Eukaryota sp. TZLM1-RC]